MSTPMDHTPVAVRISVPPERGGQDGTVRAAREMLAVAARMPGFIFHEPIEDRGTLIAFELYWTDVRSVDTWRSRLYDAGLRKYSPEAWETFEGIELVEGRTLVPTDVNPAPVRPASTAVQRRAERLWSVFGSAKKQSSVA